MKMKMKIAALVSRLGVLAKKKESEEGGREESGGWSPSHSNCHFCEDTIPTGIPLEFH
jgi:hypothetical protein